ncbi:MAG: hypothetical protein JSS02_03205 [Planctomycetes bacterium]|nr:hypothetical protein [Planctomycetota bacterium]
MTKSRYLLLLSIFATVVCVRTLPYVLGALDLTNIRQVAGFLWNFSPVTALFLFAGTQATDRRWAFGMPLTAMAISDVLITVLMKLTGADTQGLYAGLPASYGAYALIVVLGAMLRKIQPQPATSSIGAVVGYVLAAVGTGLAGEAAFFLITNFSYWMFQSELYPHTLSGLRDCYIAAIPFAKNGFLSTPFYSAVLFGTSVWVAHLAAASQQPANESQAAERALVA